MKRYLDAEQIKVLEKNGIKTKNNPDFAYVDLSMEHPWICIYELLELLPKKLKNILYDGVDGPFDYILMICPFSNRVWYGSIEGHSNWDDIPFEPFELEVFKSDELVDSLFNALVWVITNKYIQL